MRLSTRGRYAIPVAYMLVFLALHTSKPTNAFLSFSNSKTSNLPISIPCFAGSGACTRQSQMRAVATTTTLNMGIFGDIMKELDNFIDDAMDRKLGGGSTFYGERKSSFTENSKSYTYTAKAEADKRDKARNFVFLDPGAKKRGGILTGEELRRLIFNQWGQQFPVLIKRRRDALGTQQLYLIVQWKYLGKRNLKLSEEEYVAESDAVAELLTEWGVANSVKNTIQESNARPKTMTQQFPGLFILLDVDSDVIDTW